MPALSRDNSDIEVRLARANISAGCPGTTRRRGRGSVSFLATCSPEMTHRECATGSRVRVDSARLAPAAAYLRSGQPAAARVALGRCSAVDGLEDAPSNETIAGEYGLPRPSAPPAPRGLPIPARRRGAHRPDEARRRSSPVRSSLLALIARWVISREHCRVTSAERPRRTVVGWLQAGEG